MGLFNTKKTIVIKKRKTPKEKMLERQLRFLAKVEHEKPHIYERYMMKELGIPTEDEKGEIGKFKDTLGALQEVGAFKSSDELGGGMFGGMMKDLMPIIALGILGQMNPGAARMMQDQMQERGLLPDQTQGQLPPGDQAPPAENVDVGPTEGGSRMFSPQSWLFIQLVKGKSPAQAASMIIGAQKESATAREIVEGFCKAKDNEELQGFIEATVRAHPEFRGFFEWAVKQNWDGQPAPAWFLLCIQEIRSQVAGPGNQPAKQAMGL